MKELDSIFNTLWKKYSSVNTQAEAIHSLLGNVENDHIALRTFDSYLVGLKVFSKIFTDLGYEEKGEYKFDTKNLTAKHYEKEGYPKVFISQLNLGELSIGFNNIVSKCLLDFSRNPLTLKDFLLSGNLPWSPISYEEYNILKEESEYGAWLCTFGFVANHFTVSVNKLKEFDNLSILNLYLKNHGFILNSSGGEIKGSKEEGLMQSSTMASKVKVNFSDGEYEIPCCYYEFAERFGFEGFIAGSADKIFESTDNKNG